MSPFKNMFERMENESYEANTNFKLDMNDANTTADVNIKMERDQQTKNSLVTLSGDMSIGDRKFTSDANIFYNKDKAGIKVEELYDKYVVVENRDLKKLAGLFGLDEEDVKDIPDSIPETDYSANKEKIETLSKKYTERIFEQISSDKYSVEKDVQTDNP